MINGIKGFQGFLARKIENIGSKAGYSFENMGQYIRSVLYGQHQVALPNGMGTVNATEDLFKFSKNEGGASNVKLNELQNGFNKAISEKNVAEGVGNAGLSSTKSIDSKVLKELKKMGLDKKFQNAMDKGLAPRREGTSGIIKLTEGEIEYKGEYEYIYKIKVPKAGGHTRVYGRINESGELIFDLILKK